MKSSSVLVILIALATAPLQAQSGGGPPDSVYRVARRALDSQDYAKAATTFDLIASRYPRSSYGPDALYWKGFSLYRAGDLDGAQKALEAQASRFPNAPTQNDAAALLILVKGELAKRGSASAQRDVNRAANSATGKGCEDMDVQIAALDAVQQMDADRAVPLLKRVVARRDECSVYLRKNAVFILAQRGGAEREKILLDVAKTDPSIEVRKDAVFHLSASHSELAIDALEEVLLRVEEPAMRADALFALANMNTERSKKIVQTFALSPNAPLNLRKDAFFHLASKATADDMAWLRQAYSRVDDEKIRADLLFQIASKPSPETSKWLVALAADTKETLDNRKNAIFYLAQRKDDPAANLAAVYDGLPSAPMKKDVIFYLGQRKDDASLDKLIAIAKSDPSIELRKEALFHLGQSKNPKAMKAIEDIVVP